jgi:hypothetical protein
LLPPTAAIAELVLWIGYLQWHFRTRGRVAPPEPIIKAFHNIECRDAVLTSDSATPVLDAQGQPVTPWDGRTMKKHPVTGEDVPRPRASPCCTMRIRTRRSGPSRISSLGIPRSSATNG